MSTLDELGHKYGTDKASPTEAKPHFHDYLNIMEPYLEPIRDKVKTLLEIGAGYGGSLRMWQEYFPNAKIYSMDNGYETKGKIFEGAFKGDQENRDDLAMVVDAVRSIGFDIIIDDGGHTMEQQQVSLAYLFPFLREGGLYIIEDLLTSRAKGKKYNPTGTTWTTLRFLDALSKGQALGTDFCTGHELYELRNQVESVTIELGKHSEIAFIRKKA